ncbi:MAG: hypothetical protein PHZ25_02630 [Candidatus Pacebacteria bacterium]|nr:hypothetical protein [Candidatus Paceibacterota bacterium]
MENKVSKDLIILPNKLIKIKYKKPYILRFKNKNQEMIYFGAEHSNSYKDKHFSKIEKILEEFIKENGFKKVIILAEGILPEKDEKKEALIEKYKEAGMLYYLAQKNKIKIESLELTLEEIIKETIKDGFKKERIILWLFINLLWGKLGNNKEKRNIKEEDLKETEQTLFIICKKLKIVKKKEDASIKFLIKKFKEETGKDILEIKMNEIKKYQSPFKNDFPTNKVSSHINFIKDYFMAKEIIERLEDKKSVFASAGHNHVVAQEPVLKKFFILPPTLRVGTKEKK